MLMDAAAPDPKTLSCEAAVAMGLPAALDAEADDVTEVVFPKTLC